MDKRKYLRVNRALGESQLCSFKRSVFESIEAIKGICTSENVDETRKESSAWPDSAMAISWPKITR